MNLHVLSVCAVLIATGYSLGGATRQGLFSSRGSFSGGNTSSGYAASSDSADYQRDQQFRKWSK